MSSLHSPLHNLQVAAPCSASWEEMKGDKQVRFCESCALYVYNLSAMTAQQAERLVERKEGRLCVRFFQREDGTVMTQDCPRGLMAIRRGARRTALTIGMSVAAMFLLIFGLLGTALAMSRGRNSPSPIKSITGWLNGGTSGGSNVQGGLAPPGPVMGDVCPVENPPKPAPPANPPQR